MWSTPAEATPSQRETDESASQMACLPTASYQMPLREDLRAILLPSMAIN